MKVSKLLFALMLAAGATAVAFGPATAQERKAAPGASAGQLSAEDCKAASPGDKAKAREKVAAGTAQPCGEVAAAEGKGKAVAKDKTRVQVKEELKKAGPAKAGVGGPDGSAAAAGGGASPK